MTLPFWDLIRSIREALVYILTLLPNFLIWLWWFIMDIFWQIQWLIMSFMIVVHDWLWEIYWTIWTFLWSIIWPIIQILLFIPELIIEFWYYLMNLIFPTLDGICVDILLWLEENLIDPILEALQ